MFLGGFALWHWLSLSCVLVSIWVSSKTHRMCVVICFKRVSWQFLFSPNGGSMAIPAGRSYPAVSRDLCYLHHSHVLLKLRWNLKTSYRNMILEPIWSNPSSIDDKMRSRKYTTQLLITDLGLLRVCWVLWKSATGLSFSLFWFFTCSFKKILFKSG